METRTGIWPFDILNDPRQPERDHPNHLKCFLICPFTPKDVFDDIYVLVQDVCNKVGGQLQCQVECVRADKIASPGIIQSEIWHHIQTEDIVIADVTGLNGNVMIELGVASACRKKEHVIILKEDNPNEKFLFDIGPARHIVYRRTYRGFQDLFQNLYSAILMSMTSAPFEIEPKISVPHFPLKVDFTKGKHVDWLIGPSLTHRRLMPDCLEFGSLFVFRNSWLSVANLEISKFEITAEMKFSQLRDVVGWIGISVRSQNFFANFGHLLYLASNGKAARTIPKDEFGSHDDDYILGDFPDFSPREQKFYKFRIEADDQNIAMFVNGIGGSFKISEMPFVYPSGRILFQTYYARAGIRNIEIKQM